MDNVIEAVLNPWPWYVAGPLIGLTVPLLLVLGNKNFGVSSSLRHICAICVPARIPFFHYDWRKELWNLFFIGGITIGAFITWQFLTRVDSVTVDPALARELSGYGVENYSKIYPVELFNFESLVTLRGFILMVVGGFLVGFGTRYAGGCTSGHSITGIATLQMASVIATVCFMAGGILVANFVLPYILNL